MGNDRQRSRSGHSRAQLDRKVGGERLCAPVPGIRSNIVSWKTKRASVDHIRRRAVGVLSDGRSQAQQDEREMRHPLAGPRGRSSGHETVLEGPMEALNHSVRLWVISSCLLVRDAQETGEFLPKPGRKLAAPVSHNGGRDSKPGNPVTEESEGTGLGRDSRHRNSLHPPRKSVHHSQEIAVALGLGERTNEVKVDGGEAAVGHVQGGQGSLGVSCNLGALAMKARATKMLCISRHLPPHKSTAKVAEEGIPTRMDQSMGGVQKQGYQLSGNDGTRGGRGHRRVAEETEVGVG